VVTPGHPPHWFVISRSSVQVRAPAPALSRLVGFSIQKHDATSVHSAAVVRANSPLSAVVSCANGRAATLRWFRGVGNVVTRRKLLVAGTYRLHRFGGGGVGLRYGGIGAGHEAIAPARVSGQRRSPTSGRTPNREGQV